MYVVRFIRRDGKPQEEYIYPLFKDADYHSRLFEKDDSGLYQMVQLEKADGMTRTIIYENAFRE